MTGEKITRVVARGLVKTYGGTAALRGVDVVLTAGTLTVIEGANGSGKSTLLGILGTVVRQTSGEVAYEPFGSDVVQARSTLGWLSHESLTYPDLTGRQNVELAARLYGLEVGASWRAAEERFEIGSFSARAMRTCSRGQRQRIALARALVHSPSLVLLDEPTTGLDGQGVKRLLKVVEEETKRGAAVAVVTHEAAVFAALAGARVVLERGRVKKDVSRETSA